MAADIKDKTALISGVSSGIGAATTSLLLSRGYFVFGTVRSLADADKARTRWGARFHPLIVDITDQTQIDEAAAQMSALLGDRPLAALVNNSGISLPGAILDIPMSELRRHIDVNLIGHLAMTRAFMPFLLRKDVEEQNPGRIIMMSSVSGECAYPFVGAYAISKFGLEALSDVLRRELMPLGVKVVTISPTSVNTPIWDKAEAVDLHQYQASTFYSRLSKIVPAMIDQGRHGMDPGNIAEIVARALASSNPKTRYRIAQRPLMAAVLRQLPDKMLDKFLMRLYASLGA